MASLSSIGASCPSGGSFYVCQNNATEFVGCCTVNPCETGSGVCPTRSLRPASFSSDSYDSIPPQQCGGDKQRALWYSCAFTKPPFMGCCEASPCSAGSCHANDLAPAFLSSDARDRSIFVDGNSDPAPTTSSTAAPTPSLPDTGSSGGGLHTGAIVGIAIGATVVAMAMLSFLVFRCRRNRRRAAVEDSRGGRRPRKVPAGYGPVPIMGSPEGMCQMCVLEGMNKTNL
jgi:hypothetical protein